MRRICAALGALAIIAGCGGSDPEPPPADPVAVARAWTDAVRQKDYAAANELFAVPATVTNGSPPIRLESESEIDDFNRSLPCGAFVTGAERLRDGYVRMMFRLTKGPGCDSGDAEVTFRVVDGRITEWLRETVGPPPGTTET